MAIVVSNIRTSIEAGPQQCYERALRILGLRQGQVQSIGLVKCSVDARHRDRISLVSSVSVSLEQGEKELVERLARPDVTLRAPLQFDPQPGREWMEHRPVVVGLGPAGLFAALLLAQKGYRPLVLERGSAVEDRVSAVERFWHEGLLDPQTNVQFGEGGAGTFSDGKLTTRIGDPLCEHVLQQFVRFGAEREILWRAKPHMGTDRLRAIVKAIRQEAERLGATVRFGTRAERFVPRPDGTISLWAGGEQIVTSALILAVGHSARDTFSELMDASVQLVPKPFSVGVRIEHLQSAIDRALYGDFAGHPALRHGEYQLSHRADGRAVYTFCMCPGGTVVPAASEEGGVVVNGMSKFARDKENANSALVVSVDERDYGSSPLDAIAFQRRLEQQAYVVGGRNYRAPAQTVGRFLQGRAGMQLGRVQPSYALGTCEADFTKLFSQQITDFLRTGLQVFDRRLRGFAAEDAVLTGVETRTSSPVRILRGEDGQAVGTPGLYPCGEGAGYAGGIMSAAVDGLRQAQQIIERFAPPCTGR